ncbi:FtsH protease activity modulator HflK [Halofilum ochraceum]|uniref:FtsH protease activity modulator HflK n=1 Tax=Halofilum ochraceum TaxID=1611323 RepID=UPI0008356B8B|nr:FtsH protease activity modulator HflK [Halofilum ochraceum]
MAWNEPGGGGNRDPWGNRGSGGDGGPPDLDEALRKVKNRLSGLFGGGGNSGGSGSGGGSGGVPNISPKLAWGVLGLVFLGWLASGFYIIQAAERGIVTRFGAFVAEVGPGPHWHLPWPVESVETVNVAENRSLTLQQQGMLTRDENVVVVDMSVQYDVKDATAFLFEVRAPEETLHQVIESVVREVVGKNRMDFIITEGRGEVANRVHELAQGIVDEYSTGLNIQAVNLRNAQPPEPVQPAFEDAITAREDQQRFINEARAVRNRIIPGARGEAAQTIEEARAYRTRVVESAEGDVSRFTALLNEYQQDPQVTRKRLYMDTMERVLSNTGKVLVDREGEGRNMIYLPLDRMANQPSGQSSSGNRVGLPSAPMSSAAGSDGDSSRGNRPDRSRESN